MTALPPLPPGLQILSCPSNDLVKLPLLPPTLTELSCYNNKLSVLPSLPAGLKELTCHANRLATLPPLPDSLEEFWCGRNQLTILPEFHPNLRRIWVHKNPWIPSFKIYIDAYFGNTRAAVRSYYAAQRAKQLVSFRLSVEPALFHDVASVVGSFISGVNGTVDQQLAELKRRCVLPMM